MSKVDKKSTGTPESIDVIQVSSESKPLTAGERQELYDIEDEYIEKYDSIRHGYNIRRNYKNYL